ncbi:MAG: thiamine phosphate synthase [Candidatus Omnitrophota bacterium]
MKSRKNLLKKSQLYLILNRQLENKGSLEKICSDFSGKGIDVIQLRDKVSAKKEVLNFALYLAKYFKASKTLFIINDYTDIALASGADGVHLGQDDSSIKEAKKILGKGKIIGVSCHSLQQALKAQKEGADYIGIGPIYSTPTKPEYKAIGLETLRQLKGKIKIPYFAIGDIGQENIKAIVANGATRVAVCRAILNAKSAKRTVRQLNNLLGKK